MSGTAPSDATVSTLMIRPIVLVLEKHHIDLAKVAESAGISLEALGDRDARIPRKNAVRAWLAAGDALGDDVLGIHVAEAAPAGMYGVYEYAIRSSATIGGAMKQLARHYRIVSSMSSVGVETTKDEFRVTHKAPGTPPAVVDNLFAVVVRAGRELTGTSLPLREVKLTRAAPSDTSTHERFFRAPIRFSSHENALVFDAAVADYPLVTADADIHAAFAKRTEDLLGGLPAGDRFLQRVRVAIVSSLQAGTGASLAALAKSLGTSARTLQRRLGESMTTRSTIVDEVRHELALRYLEDGMGSTEIAYLLGFSEAAAFHRAFKRWTKSTLKDYRLRSR